MVQIWKGWWTKLTYRVSQWPHIVGKMWNRPSHASSEHGKKVKSPVRPLFGKVNKNQCFILMVCTAFQITTHLKIYRNKAYDDHNTNMIFLIQLVAPLIKFSLVCVWCLLFLSSMRFNIALDVTLWFINEKWSLFILYPWFWSLPFPCPSSLLLTSSINSKNPRSVF